MKFRSLIAALLILLLVFSLPCAAESQPKVLTPSAGIGTSLAIGGYDLQSLSATRLQALQKTLHTAVTSCAREVDISSYRLRATQENVDALANLICYEIPEAFHVDFSKTGFAHRFNQLEGIQFVYTCDKTQYQSTLASVDAVVEQMTADLQGLGEQEKALLLHDRLALRCEYAYAELNNGTVYNTPEFFNMLGPLLGKRAVCQGYTIAYSYLLRSVGITVRACTSSALNHAWNIVTVGGKEYHVDVTFDDPVEDVTGYVTHTNFLLSSAALYPSHSATDYNTAPTDTTYDNYFWQDVVGAFQQASGAIYYPDNTHGTINKYTDHSVLYTLEERWPISYTTYIYLSSDNTYLLFSTPTAIRRIHPQTLVEETLLKPQPPAENQSIYGFMLEGDELVLEFNTSPYYDASTKRLYQRRYAYTEPKTLEDAILLLQFLIGLPIHLNQSAMDLTGDGSLTIADAVMLLRYLAA